MGFTLDKTDEVKPSEEVQAPKQQRSLKGLVIQAGVMVTLTVGFFGYMYSSHVDRVDKMNEHSKAKTEQVVVTETKKTEPLQVAQQSATPVKVDTIIIGDEAVKLYGDQLMSLFNKEINSVSENEIFKSSFSVESPKVLIMKVDTANAMKAFGQTEEVINLGISQGADAYRSYLQRFNNRIWNGKGEGLSLKVVNLKGETIREVTL